MRHFKIDGKDFSKCIYKYGQFEGVEKVHGKNEGETLDGTRIEDIVKYRTVLQMNCNPLTESDAAMLIGALNKDFVEVEFISLKTNALRTLVMYSEIGIGQFALSAGGVGYWKGFTIDLRER